MTKPLYDETVTRRKDRRKRLRAAMQLAIIVGAVGIGSWQYMTAPVYRSYAAADNGAPLLTLVQTGVENDGGRQGVVTATELRRRLQALQSAGYETVTAAEVKAHYEQGAPLPPKPLQLVFTDGRRDTAVFALPVLEALQYHGTLLLTPALLTAGDEKLLHADDWRRLGRSSFWSIAAVAPTADDTESYETYGIEPVVLPDDKAERLGVTITAPASWSTNRLIADIRRRTGTEIPYSRGERPDTAEVFTVHHGALAGDDETLTLTAESGATATAMLNGYAGADTNVRVVMNGGDDGIQGVYVRADEELRNYIAVDVDNRRLVVRDVSDGTARTVADEPLASRSAETGRAVMISAAGPLLTVTADGGAPVRVEVRRREAGRVVLTATAAAPVGDEGQGPSPAAPYDGRYDARFTDLTVRDDGTRQEIFTTRYSGMAAVTAAVKSRFDRLLDWFIHSL